MLFNKIKEIWYRYQLSKMDIHRLVVDSLYVSDLCEVKKEFPDYHRLPLRNNQVDYDIQDNWNLDEEDIRIIRRTLYELKQYQKAIVYLYHDLPHGKRCYHEILPTWIAFPIYDGPILIKKEVCKQYNTIYQRYLRTMLDNQKKKHKRLYPKPNYLKKKGK